MCVSQGRREGARLSGIEALCTSLGRGTMRLTRGRRFGELHLGTEGRCPSLEDGGSARYLGTDGCRVSLVDEGGGVKHLFQELRDNVRLSGMEGGHAPLRDGGVVHLFWGQRHYAPHSGMEVW